ncbi:MAG: hypothetical protein ACFCUX_06645 [Candidatus Methylacidiphilales bacterium]
MNSTTHLSLDASALTAFSATLATLPADEIRKAKSLFLRNSISDYKMSLKASKGFLVVMGIMCIIPIFLVVFIPAYLGYKAEKENGRQKIINALEVWRADLGAEYDALLSLLNR